ncbi:NAD(P)-dependent oxidoreductase [uncultured Thiodictyon sp.]|uniref:NAD-dependent epimerase/dehydratase family protein n=1 Tax=uncultured Thiodictyon sp. TaxID=1846217 RepID=UPI0025DCE1F7|nr:NAD(P)-dependent oxidoreductase [uncultured Thiodictyon sp.]
MTVRWITDRLGTSPWEAHLAEGALAMVDVRILRDAAGNSPALLREKIAEALNYLKKQRTVVICCDHGISRSNAIAAAVLAANAGITFNECLHRVIQATGETGIKIDLIEDLRNVLDQKRCRPSGSGLFVLGSDGFIGRSITKALDLNLPSIQPTSDRDLLDNPALLDTAMDAVGADRVLFCWLPRRLDTNRAAGELIACLRNVLEVCRIRQAGLIFLSGHQVFAGHGGSGQVSFWEMDQPVPAGAAGDALFLAETLIQKYELLHGLSALIVRHPHLYGVGDERPGIVNTLIRKALLQQQILTHCFNNGAPVIDITHVDDFVRALSLAIERQLTGILHVASGNPIRMDELARLVVRLTDRGSTVASVAMPGNHSMVRLESRILYPVLKWRSAIDLKTGLSELIPSCIAKFSGD